MKKTYILLLFLISFISNAQKVQFTYDNAGNQTARVYCLCAGNRTSGEPVKEVAALKEEDLLKFFPEDVISYYPNPVQDQLYLKWELTNDNKVSTIQLFALTGQLLKSYSKLENTNDKVLSFQEYPKGIYNLFLVYTNGEQKSIKIIKN